MPRALALILLTLLLVPAAARADDFSPVIQSCSAGVATAGCTVAGTPLIGAQDVAVSPDGRFAYVAASSTDTLLVMERDPATGALTQRSCVNATGAGGCVDSRAMDQPSDVELSPDGAQVYLASELSGVAVFDRNAQTGALLQKPGQDGCIERLFQTEGCRPVNGIAIGEGAVSLRLGPDANPTELYVGTRTGGILNLDRAPGTGVLTQVAGAAGCARDDGNFACLDTTGMGTGPIRQFAVSRDGRNLYVPSSTLSGVAILKRVAGTGTLEQSLDVDACITATGSPIANVNKCRVEPRLAGGPQTVELSADGRQLYVATGDRVVVLARDDEGLLSFASCANRTGSLGCAGGARNMVDPEYLAISPDGEDLVVGSGSNGLAFFHRGAGGALTQNPGIDGCLTSSGSAFDTGVTTPGACRSQPAAGFNAHVQFASADQLYAAFFVGSAVLAIKRDFAPRCANASLAVPFETALAVPLACADRNGDAFSLSITAPPNAGLLGAIDPVASRVFYNPVARFSGADSFKYQAVSGGQVSNPATVSLSVAAAPPASPGGLDRDRDGFFAGQDCNDANPAIRPGAREVRGNRVDENCDGLAEPFPTVTSGVSAKWLFNGPKFTLTQLTISNPPKGAKFEFRCAGRACPVRSKKLTGKLRRGLVDVRKSLGGKLKYRAGQTIEVRISAPGFNTKAAQIRLRAGRTPSVIPLCLPPGASKPQKTCT